MVWPVASGHVGYSLARGEYAEVLSSPSKWQGECKSRSGESNPTVEPTDYRHSGVGKYVSQVLIPCSKQASVRSQTLRVLDVGKNKDRTTVVSTFSVVLKIYMYTWYVLYYRRIHFIHTLRY